MAVQRIRIILGPEEYTALEELARAELRPLEHQARYLLRHELEQRGLLIEHAEIEDMAEGARDANS